jgi:hypothetical protein
MKFHQLPEGTSFVHAGTLWVKTGPVTAVDDQGKARILPRSAAVQPVNAPRVAESRPRAAAGTVRLLAARVVYRRELEARVGALAGQLGATELASLKRDLAAIGQAFLRRAGVATDAT